MGLLDKIGKVSLDKKVAKPVWEGPEGKGNNGGVTQSLLQRFLCCRERFRLHVIEGLRVKDKFNSKIEYGNLFHTAEEAFSKETPQTKGIAAALAAIENYSKSLATRYPFSRDDISHWYSLAIVQFPEYIRYWSKHPDILERTPLMQEQKFDILYALPSGRKVRLRGKWDSVELVGKGKNAGIYIGEMKTKSQIDQQKLSRQLSCDLQSMLYAVALWEKPSSDLHREGYYRHGGGQAIKGVTRFGGIDAGEYPIKGVRYNVIRRSAHKTAESMNKKMTEDIADNRGQEWFSRWTVDITSDDIKRFRQRTLDPILEQLCDWYTHISNCHRTGQDPFGQYADSPNGIHSIAPYGVYDVLKEGGSTDLDVFIADGSEVGLHRVTEMFEELKDG